MSRAGDLGSIWNVCSTCFFVCLLACLRNINILSEYHCWQSSKDTDPGFLQSIQLGWKIAPYKDGAVWKWSRGWMVDKLGVYLMTRHPFSSSGTLSQLRPLSSLTWVIAVAITRLPYLQSLPGVIILHLDPRVALLKHSWWWHCSV